MTTQEAFEKMISERGIHNQLGLDSGTVRFYRNQIKEQGKYPSIDKMMELLEKGGFKLLTEMAWEQRFRGNGKLKI